MGNTPAASLAAALARPEGQVWVAEIGSPLCIFGVTPIPEHPHMGAPWLLCTPLFRNHPVAMVRLARHMLALWHRRFPILANAADARNADHLRFVQRLGFNLLPPQPAGPFGMPFVPFFRCA